MEERKIMVVDASVENCETNISIGEGDIFELAKEDVLTVCPLYKDEIDDILETLRTEGKYIDPDDEAGDPVLIYRKNGSPFKTDELVFKYWSPDDILSRFNITYIVMPEEKTAPRGKLFQTMREDRYGTSILDTFTAKDWDDAVKLSHLDVLYTLERAYEQDPEESWDDVHIVMPDKSGSDAVFAHGIDISCFRDSILPDTYMSLIYTGYDSTEEPGEIDKDEKILLDMAYLFADEDLFGEGMKKVFAMKAQGCTMEEIREALIENEALAEKIFAADNPSFTVCDSPAQFIQESLKNGAILSSGKVVTISEG